MTTYYGKYRGTVVDNLDPMQVGRLAVTVADLSPDPLGWAMPCFPVAGVQAGAWMIPNPGAGVWVEFEQGELAYPIWSGCWYGSAAEVPALALAESPVMPIVLQTPGQTVLMLSDLPGPAGGILLKTITGALISVTDDGITLSNGRGATIALVGATVTVNDGALSVT